MATIRRTSGAGVAFFGLADAHLPPHVAPPRSPAAQLALMHAWRTLAWEAAGAGPAALAAPPAGPAVAIAPPAAAPRRRGQLRAAAHILFVGAALVGLHLTGSRLRDLVAGRPLPPLPLGAVAGPLAALVGACLLEGVGR